MEPLQNLQNKIWSRLKSPVLDADCSDLIVDSGKLSSLDRLNIYRNTISTAHISALVQCYTVCEKILGERYFKQLAQRYYFEYPAISQNLNEYGRHFPLFLKSWISKHDELNDFNYLVDLATLENSIEQAYYAKDDPSFSFEQNYHFDEFTRFQVYFRLSYSLSVIRTSFPIYEIWHSNINNDNNQEIEGLINEEFLCVVREDYEPVVYKIDEASGWLLERINKGSSLAEIAEDSARNKIDIQLHAIIPELIEKKWICKFEVKQKFDHV